MNERRSRLVVDLKDRERALEDQFFLKQEAKQIAALKDAEQREATKEGLRSASSIDDDGVLDKLVEIGISADSLAAVSLVPLVEVAWADGRMQDDERDAILKGAKGTGIEEGSGAHELLAGWLRQKPDAELFTAWSGYIEALREQLTAEQLEILRRQVIDRARAVAAAAGGFLGIKKISDDEERALAHLDAAFDGPAS
jgi:hypothetical protein